MDALQVVGLRDAATVTVPARGDNTLGRGFHAAVNDADGRFMDMNGGVTAPQTGFIADRHNPRHQRKTGIAPERHQRNENNVEDIRSRADRGIHADQRRRLAQGTSPAPSASGDQSVKAPAAKIVKAKKHHKSMKKHVRHVAPSQPATRP